MSCEWKWEVVWGTHERERGGGDSWMSRRGQLLHRGFPQFHCFWKIFKHPISRQLNQRSEWRKEEENNRLGGDGERARGRNGLMVGDTALECCSGFNYRQRNSLFKYLEYRWSLWLCVFVCTRLCVCVCTLHTCIRALPCENLFVCAHVYMHSCELLRPCLCGCVCGGDFMCWVCDVHVVLHVDAAVNVKSFRQSASHQLQCHFWVKTLLKCHYFYTFRSVAYLYRHNYELRRFPNLQFICFSIRLILWSNVTLEKFFYCRFYLNLKDWCTERSGIICWIKN